eukprot:6210102-Pleurochrysis_carterae.AAC.1
MPRILSSYATRAPFQLYGLSHVRVASHTFDETTNQKISNFHQEADTDGLDSVSKATFESEVDGVAEFGSGGIRAMIETSPLAGPPRLRVC